MRITAQDFIKAFKDSGSELRPRSYSGRCMYGSRCIGIDMDDAGQLLEVAALLIMQAEVDCEDVAELSRHTRTDSMGRGMIAYWPCIKLTTDDLLALEEQEEFEGSI